MCSHSSDWQKARKTGSTRSSLTSTCTDQPTNQPTTSVHLGCPLAFLTTSCSRPATRLWTPGRGSSSLWPAPTCQPD